jgi:hypothetical protein
MNNNLKYSATLGGFVAAAVLTALSLAQPSSAQAARSLGAPAGHPSSGTCTVEISTVSLTPLDTYDGSGGNILFSGALPSEAACDKQAIAQWHTALSTGWSAANRCAIIAGTGPSDEILTEITYIWNSNASIREDGYAVMCHPTVDVPAPAY